MNANPRLREIAGYVLERAGKRLCALGRWVGGREEVRERGDEMSASGFDDAGELCPRPSVTLSEKAQRMIAEGAAQNRTSRATGPVVVTKRIGAARKE